MIAVNVPLRALIEFAFSLTPDQIRALPDWTATTRYDISATAAKPSNSQPPGGSSQPALTLRSLLADRFHLKVHNETRQMPVYELRRSSRSNVGPHLVASARNCKERQAPPEPRQVPCGVGIGMGYAKGGGVPLGEFAEGLSRILKRPVIDRTGLTGNFDAQLTFNPELLAQSPIPPGVVPRVDANAPSIFVAVQEQLGLRLEPARGPVEVLVIDHIERPTPN